MRVLQSGIKALATRCDCLTEEIINNYPIELELRLIHPDPKYPQWVYIVKGFVTGFESFPFTQESILRLCQEGWTACAGTEKRWDALYVPADQMVKIYEQLVAGQNHGG